jgi:sulfatase maturation enzyme AslB (radical SAM superfamily)
LLPLPLKSRPPGNNKKRKQYVLIKNGGGKMANIMVNEACNLRCPYCFASEFVNQNPKEMTLEDFKEALEFVLGDGSHQQVGIIGGEPTIYKHINEALEIAIKDVRAYPVMIFTNAVTLENIRPELLEDRKFRMLVNCNSPEDMGKAKYDKMRENINKFIHEHIGEGRFKLSINLYKPDFDYSYVLDLVEEFQCDSLRMSISVPSNDLDEKDSLAYFKKMKPVVMNFTMDLLKAGVIPGFDCNFMPLCLLTEEEIKNLMGIKEHLREYLKNYNSNILRKNRDVYGQSFWERSIICELQKCTPVIDILPDLTAVRCFGLSEHTKQNIRDFEGISDLIAFYEKNVDRETRDFYTSSECQDCDKRKNRVCSAGCHIFKVRKMVNSGEKFVGLA